MQLHLVTESQGVAVPRAAVLKAGGFSAQGRVGCGGVVFLQLGSELDHLTSVMRMLSAFKKLQKGESRSSYIVHNIFRQEWKH